MTDRDPRSPCGGTAPVPRRPDNPPGLPEIAYRITTQPESFARMTWSLPRQAVGRDAIRPLEALRTRSLDDPTISLLDAFAVATDVLSFYSDVVANEGYVGTATQRRSVLELARMIGYELAPGVAASVHLAFDVEASDDPYRVVAVGTGVQAMSIPAKKDELPQIFETVEAITARAEWNAIPARTQRQQDLALYQNPGDDTDARNGTLFLFDLDGGFDADALADADLVTVTVEADLASFHPMRRGLDLGAALARRITDHSVKPDVEPVLRALPVNEIYLAGVGLKLRPGLRVLALGQGTEPGDLVHARPLRVVLAVEDRAFNLTRVVLTESGRPPEKVRRAPRFRLATLVAGVLPVARLTLDRAAIETTVRGARWSGAGMAALVRAQSWPRDRMMTLIAKVLRPIQIEEKDEVTPLGLHVMREDSAFFGSLAPLHATLNFGEADPNGPFNHDWDSAPNTIWTTAGGTPLPGPAQAYLDREVDGIQPGSWAILENSSGASLGLRVAHAAREARSDYALSGKVTGVAFETAAGAPVEPGGALSLSIYNNFLFRDSRLYGASEHRPLAGIPLGQELPEGADSVELDRLYLDLERGRPISISGARLDAEGLTGRETHYIAQIHHIDGITRILIDGETAYPYDRTTLRINANVALATHGETVAEALGSGDARLVNQRFVLSKPPLTYVSSASETGRASTLEVRVNGVRWDEVPALGKAGADDAVFQCRIANDGKTTVCFGDGRFGRRLPTGEMNVTARYRSGIGTPGLVAEEAIAQLKARPLGIRAVVNPSQATGAADSEALDLARTNAPGTVKTLGRVVSLSDYADFATAFAGVGKAAVRELWSGQDKIVHLTVAPEADSELGESDDLMLKLAAAIARLRDPARPMLIQPYARRLFGLKARLSVDPAYLPADVAKAAHAWVGKQFGYAARTLAKPVSAAEVIAALHAVDGVVAVDLDGLSTLTDGSSATTTGTDISEILPALPALGPGKRGEGVEFSPAELLTVLPSAVILSAEEVRDA